MYYIYIYIYICDINNIYIYINDMYNDIYGRIFLSVPKRDVIFHQKT